MLLALLLLLHCCGEGALELSLWEQLLTARCLVQLCRVALREGKAAALGLSLCFHIFPWCCPCCGSCRLCTAPAAGSCVVSASPKPAQSRSETGILILLGRNPSHLQGLGGE